MPSESYRIRFLPLAFEDIDGIDSYIAETLESPMASKNLMDEMEAGIRQLEDFPYIGSTVEDAYLASKGYRKLIIQNYLVFHLVNDADREIIIMRVLYGARESHNLL